jgi:protein TonB
MISQRTLSGLVRNALFVLALAAVLAACQPSNPPPAVAVPAPTDVIALDTPPPSYPEAVACQGIGGTVTLQITIGTDGHTHDWQPVTGSGNAALDAAALEAVKAWRFRPATRAGQPVESRIQVPVTFNPPQELPSSCYQYGPRSST